MVTILLQKILDLLRKMLRKPGVNESASGAEVATFTTNTAEPLTSATFGIMATQDEGTPSVESPIEIEGYTGINVSISGEDTSDPTVIPVSWQAEAGTVYAGEVDAISGKLKVTHKLFTFVGDDSESWSNVAAGGNRANTISIGASIAQPTDTAPMCNEFVAVSYAERDTSVANTCYVTPTGSLAVITTTDYNTSSKFKALIAENNLKVLIKLATPIEYDITPAEINSLVGVNNIWGDTNGSVSVVYRFKIESQEELQQAAGSGTYTDLTDDLTIDFETIEESSCDVKAYRQGNIVVVELNYLVYLTTPTDTGVIISGLPKAKNNTTVWVNDLYSAPTGNGGRMRVNTDGQLTQWYFRPYPNHQISGQIIYITDEV